VVAVVGAQETARMSTQVSPLLQLSCWHFKKQLCPPTVCCVENCLRGFWY